jgi:hypothetical protein
MHLKPSYLPYSDVAPDLVKSLTEERGLLLNKKNKIILASFLAVAKEYTAT